MQLGLSTYALNWWFGMPGHLPEKPLGLSEFLGKVADLGYQGVQIADNSPLSRLAQVERQNLWKQANDLGLFVEIGARGLTVENLKSHLAIACEAKSPLLRFVIDGPGFEPSLEELPDLLAQAAATCGESGIILAIENHDRFQAQQFADWFDQIDSPWLGLCLDSVNSYGCGEGFRETINTLLSYTVNFHLKDFRVRRQPHTLGLLIEGTPVGEGFLPVKSIMDRLIALGKCRTAVVEHWTAPEDTLEATIAKELHWCKVSIRNYNSLTNP